MDSQTPENIKPWPKYFWFPWFLCNFFRENQDFGNEHFNCLFQLVNNFQISAYYDMISRKKLLIRILGGWEIDDNNDDILIVYESNQIIDIPIQHADGYYIGDMKHYVLTDDDRERIREVEQFEQSLR